MNVEIGAEAALFPGKEYINGIAVAVYEWDWLMLIRAMQWIAVLLGFYYF